MAGMSSDLDVLKDIPGYKAILKSVLKSQIQLLIEQLSDHTGEEAIILTASIHDGTLSHLGSNTGKGFLDGRDEIKSQFLAFCLKSHHKKKSSEARSSPYQRPLSGQSDRITPPQALSHKRPRLQPVSLQRAGAGDSPGSSFTPPDIHRAPSQALSANGQDSSNVNVKLESSEHSVSSTEGANFVTTSVSLPTSIQLSHTQTSAEPGISDTSEGQNEDSFGDHGSENEDTAATSIKIEPITENEMELEITGVEPGKTSVAADSWSQVPGASSVSDGAVNETGDQAGYMRYPCEIPGKIRAPRGTGPTWFPCPYCEKIFGQNVILVRHIRRHTGEKPFKCSICQASFTRKSSLVSHRLSKHAGDITTVDDFMVPNTYT